MLYPAELVLLRVVMWFCLLLLAGHSFSCFASTVYFHIGPGDWLQNLITVLLVWNDKSSQNTFVFPLRAQTLLSKTTPPLRSKKKWPRGARKNKNSKNTEPKKVAKALSCRCKAVSTASLAMKALEAPQRLI